MKVSVTTTLYFTFCDRTNPTAADTHHTLTPMSPMLLFLTYLSANVSICNQMWQFTFADFSTYSMKHWHFANNANGFRLNDSYLFPHNLFVTAHQVKYYVPPSITANDISLFICPYTPYYYMLSSCMECLSGLPWIFPGAPLVFSLALGYVQGGLDRHDMNVLRCDSPIPVNVFALEAPLFRSIASIIIIMAVPHLKLTP